VEWEDAVPVTYIHTPKRLAALSDRELRRIAEFGTTPAARKAAKAELARRAKS